MKRRNQRTEDCVGKIVEISKRNVRKTRILKGSWLECNKFTQKKESKYILLKTYII